MGNVLTRILKLCFVAGGLASVGVNGADEAPAVLGIYPFADHGSMHFRTQPLLDFLQQRNVSLQLDVSDTYDELLQRAQQREYAAMQVPAHFGLYLQHCCGYRIVAGWQETVSALWLELDDASAMPAQSNQPAPVAVASPLSMVAVVMSGGCSGRVAADGQLYTLVTSGTQERALQSLLRGKVSGAIVSSTALNPLQEELRSRLRIKKEIAGLRSDVILVRTEASSTPAWQLALEQEFPNSHEATELQRRWSRPQGVVTAAELEFQTAENLAAQVEHCLRDAVVSNNDKSIQQ